ncbi:comF family protein [Duganella sp. CF402]|uniref:ComF family protein n=1 Tax=unclassified Duganella TaxID=2636909 RepID=UPI0008C97639|nr:MULTISPECIES: ComF family protein [unclassified Duganella]RZT03982.1 ComF family protein [Duganella sp. BK701]SEM52505.1 comF family protein [Duganella sp. CF402]
MKDKIALAARRTGTLLKRLLPNDCALCGGASDDALCPGCLDQFFGPAAVRSRCPRCANPLPEAAPSLSGGTQRERSEHSGSGLPIVHGLDRQLCGSCLSDPPAFDRTLVAADYDLPVDQLVLQLKFGHRLALAPLCARLLRDAVLSHPDYTLPALLCPVPLGPRRLAERGYNQALEIARPLARSMGVALHPQLVVRVHETAAQSSVAPERRQQNIAGAFAVPDAALVAGRHIGVVDDVMTSGRTLNELAATLKRHGAVQVSNLVFARTPPH